MNSRRPQIVLIAFAVASWAQHLNDHHLFQSAAQALASKDLTDRRVPEHAPFFACALRLIAGPTSPP